MGIYIQLNCLGTYLVITLASSGTVVYKDYGQDAIFTVGAWGPICSNKSLGVYLIKMNARTLPKLAQKCKAKYSRTEWKKTLWWLFQEAILVFVRCVRIHSFTQTDFCVILLLIYYSYSCRARHLCTSRRFSYKTSKNCFHLKTLKLWKVVLLWNRKFLLVTRPKSFQTYL